MASAANCSLTTLHTTHLAKGGRLQEFHRLVRALSGVQHARDQHRPLEMVPQVLFKLSGEVWRAATATAWIIQRRPLDDVPTIDPSLHCHLRCPDCGCASTQWRH